MLAAALWNGTKWMQAILWRISVLKIVLENHQKNPCYKKSSLQAPTSRCWPLWPFQRCSWFYGCGKKRIFPNIENFKEDLLCFGAICNMLQYVHFWGAKICICAICYTSPITRTQSITQWYDRVNQKSSRAKSHWVSVIFCSVKLILLFCLNLLDCFIREASKK